MSAFDSSLLCIESEIIELSNSTVNKSESIGFPFALVKNQDTSPHSGTPDAVGFHVNIFVLSSITYSSSCQILESTSRVPLQKYTPI